MTESYKALDTPHQAVHKYVNDSLSLIKSDENFDKYKDDIVQYFSQMEESSEKLFELLDKMLEEKYDDFF